MKYKALVSFSGLVTMAEGDVREIPDKSIAKDLLNAGLIMELKADRKPRKRKEKTDENQSSSGIYNKR